MKFINEMTPLLQVIWAAVFLVLLCAFCAAVTLLHLKWSQWWECSWCNHWFNGLRMRRKARPAYARGIHSHGICPVCFASQKAELQRRNLLRKSEIYPRSDFDPGSHTVAEPHTDKPEGYQQTSRA